MKESVRLGASYTIGSHILPGEPLQRLSQILDRKIKLAVNTCDKIIDGVKQGYYDIGLIESPLFDDELVYNKWMEDELVVCSNFPLGDTLDKEVLSTCQLICRNAQSLTRGVINSFLKEQNLSYEVFESLMEIDNATAAIQSIKWSRPNPENPTIAIVSQLAIEDELKNKELYGARIEGKPISRSFYLIYDRKRENISGMEMLIAYLSDWGNDYLHSHSELTNMVSA